MSSHYSKILFLILSLFLGTISYGQDKICYDREKLSKIALKLAEGEECDTLLRIAYADIDTYADMIVNFEQVIVTKDSIITLSMKDLDLCNDRLNTERQNADKYHKKLKRTRWIAGGIAVLGVIGTLIGLLL